MFGLKYRSMKRERAFFMCVTDNGLKAVKKAESVDTVAAAHAVKEQLANYGIFVNQFNFSVSGLPYAQTAHDVYTVSDYIPYNAAAFCEPQQLKAIIEIVAKMHLVCHNLTLPEEYLKKARMRLDSLSLHDIYQKNTKSLRSHKKSVLRKSRISDFDMILLNNFDRFMAALNAWYSAAQSSNSERLESEALQNKSICHNLLKEENILINGNEIYLTGFSEISIAHRVNDLAALIKRYIKACPDTPISLVEILEIYNAVCPLSSDETAYLKSLLMFPDKFLEICQSYYSKKRAFTPRAFETRMDALIDNYDFFEQYIN